MASGNLRPFSSYTGPSGLLLPFDRETEYYLPINLEDAEEEEIEWRGFRGKPIRDSEGNVEDLVVDFHHLVERSGEMAKQILKDHDCKDFTELSKKFPPVDGEPVVQIKPFDASPWFPKKEEKKLPKKRKASKSKGKSKTTGTTGDAKVKNATKQKKFDLQEELNAMLATACAREPGLQAFNSVKNMVVEMERSDPTFGLQYVVSTIDLAIMQV